MYTPFCYKMVHWVIIVWNLWDGSIQLTGIFNIGDFIRKDNAELYDYALFFSFYSIWVLTHVNISHFCFQWSWQVKLARWFNEMYWKWLMTVTAHANETETNALCNGYHVVDGYHVVEVKHTRKKYITEM